jgi:hypothetical protein
MAARASAYPLEEFKIICEMMRSYAMLRFYQMALLLGTSGGIVTAFASQSVRSLPVLVLLLKLGGVVLSAAFLVMDWRASSYWHRLRARANELAPELGFQPFPVGSPWSPLTTTGASLLLHIFFVIVWTISLFLPVARLGP